MFPDACRSMVFAVVTASALGSAAGPPAWAGTTKLAAGIESACGVLERPAVRAMIGLAGDPSAPESKALSGRLDRRSQPDFLWIDEELDRCRVALESRPPGQELPGGFRRAAAELALAEGITTRALETFAAEAWLREAMAGSSEELAALLEPPLRRQEWPPEELCSVCQSDWAAVEELRRAVAALATPEPWRKDPSLGRVRAAMARLKAERRTLCRAAEAVLAIDLRTMDAAFGYYSLTLTRDSVDTMRELLRQSKLIPWCAAW
ncbi:MAG: hypothetical protein V3T72_20320 [Thermoanaerobaculia bacterium]